MDQVKFVEDNLYKIWSDMICLGRPYHFKFFKGCLPQILLGPFLNTFSHKVLEWLQQQQMQFFAKMIFFSIYMIFFCYMILCFGSSLGKY